MRGAGASLLGLIPTDLNIGDQWDVRGQWYDPPEPYGNARDWFSELERTTQLDGVRVLPAIPSNLEQTVQVEGYPTLNRKTSVRVDTVTTRIGVGPTYTAPRRAPAPPQRPVQRTANLRPELQYQPDKTPSDAWHFPSVSLQIGPSHISIKVRPERRGSYAPKRNRRDRKSKKNQEQYRAALAFINATWGRYTEILDLWDSFESNIYTLPLEKIERIPEAERWRYEASRNYKYYSLEGNLEMLKDLREGRLHLDMDGFFEDFAINQATDAMAGRLGKYQDAYGSDNRATTVSRWTNVPSI